MKKNIGKWLIIDKYFFFQNQSNANSLSKFIKKRKNTKKEKGK